MREVRLSPDFSLGGKKIAERPKVKKKIFKKKGKKVRKKS